MFFANVVVAVADGDVSNPPSCTFSMSHAYELAKTGKTHYFITVYKLIVRARKLTHTPHHTTKPPHESINDSVAQLGRVWHCERFSDLIYRFLCARQLLCVLRSGHVLGRCDGKQCHQGRTPLLRKYSHFLGIFKQKSDFRDQWHHGR